MAFRGAVHRSNAALGFIGLPSYLVYPALTSWQPRCPITKSPPYALFAISSGLQAVADGAPHDDGGMHAVGSTYDAFHFACFWWQ